ncbi:MAG TPA: cyanophycin synthetase, partial [Geminicoccaceae bacterium]|nr:cyanophycin synthetase [Geminicoccaceae bacterium]
TFVEHVPFYGFAALCIDHPEVQALYGRITDRRVVTYGFSPQADVRALEPRLDAEGEVFDIEIRPRNGEGGRRLEAVRLSLPGLHNVSNALAAVAIARELELGEDVVRKALGNLEGVKRRFTRTGTVGGVRIIDDYGHHPVEIGHVLRTARAAATGEGRVVAVVQPHRYTRLESLFEEFCTCFNNADTVLVAPVYAAGEPPIEGVDRDALVAGIRAHGHRDVHPIDGPADLAPFVAAHTRPGDLVVCLGAGSITYWANALPGELAALARTEGAA